MRLGFSVVFAIQRGKSNFTFFNDASTDEMGPSLDLFENFPQILANDADGEKI